MLYRCIAVYGYAAPLLLRILAIVMLCGCDEGGRPTSSLNLTGVMYRGQADHQTMSIELPKKKRGPRWGKKTFLEVRDQAGRRPEHPNEGIDSSVVLHHCALDLQN